MTLRVRLEIVPFGEEEKMYQIGQLDIFNKGRVGFGQCDYGCIEINPEKNEAGLYIDDVTHRRDLGAWRLVEKVLNELVNK